jgi:hypothetical protein
MNATVRFLADEQKATSKQPAGAFVPAGAVHDHEGKKIVFLAFEGKARMREVHVLSQRTDGFLVDGLVGGESVISKGPQDLKDGDPIKIKGQS